MACITHPPIARRARLYHHRVAGANRLIGISQLNSRWTHNFIKKSVLLVAPNKVYRTYMNLVKPLLWGGFFARKSFLQNGLN
jgi:hypothetical protein